MPTIYDLKPRFQNLLRPITHNLAQRGITPNQITWLAFGLSIAEGIWLSLAPGEQAPLLALPILLFVRMGLNAIDGMLAREHDMRTPLGAMLNELGDVISDSALYLPFGALAGVSWQAAAVFTLLAMASEFAGVAAIQIGASRRYDGPMGKSDRAFAIGALGLLLGLGVSGGIWISGLFWVMSGLLILTIRNRVKRALQEVKP